MFDDDANVQLRPDLQARSPAPSRRFDLLAKGAPDTVGVGGPAIGTHQQRADGLRTSSYLPQHPICQHPVSRRTHRPSQPQPRRHHHGQTHPRDQLAPLHADFIGLHVNQIQLALLDQRVMHLLAVRPGSITPTRHRALIQAKGMHDRLHRTPIRQERHHYYDHLGRLAQPSKQRPFLRAERFSAGLAPVPWSLAPMTDDSALPNLPSCFALQVRAKYLGGIHLLCEFFHKHSLQMNPHFSSLWGLLSTS